jgi:4-hydroxybenzoate polyprenyltransferase
MGPTPVSGSGAQVVDESARLDWHLLAPRSGWASKALGVLRLARPAQLLWLDLCLSLTIFVGITGHMPTGHYLWFVLAAVLADAGACTLNDIGDLEADRSSTESNRSGRPLVLGQVSLRAAWVQGFILFLAGLAIAAWLSPWILALALALVLISYQYSFPPLHLNARPYMPQVFWFTFGILYFLAVYSYVSTYDALMPGLLFRAVAFIIGVQLFAALGETLAKDLRDLDNDRRAGKLTTSVLLGPVKSARYALYMSFAGLTVWLFAVIVLYGNWGLAAIAMFATAVVWSVVCKRLVDDLCKGYTKAAARKLHLGFISTFATLLILSMISFV